MFAGLSTATASTRAKTGKKLDDESSDEDDKPQRVNQAQPIEKTITEQPNLLDFGQNQ